MGVKDDYISPQVLQSSPRTTTFSYSKMYTEEGRGEVREGRPIDSRGSHIFDATISTKRPTFST